VENAAENKEHTKPYECHIPSPAPVNAERLSPVDDRRPFRLTVNVQPVLSDHIISCNPVEFHLA
jgi:hypothetical protein